MITPNSFLTEAEFDEGRMYMPTHYFVHEGKYIGSVDVHDHGDSCGLWALSIKKEYRGQGYGKLMMLELMAHFGHKHLYLYVEDHNTVAQHLYESVGFRPNGRHWSVAATCMEWRREYV